MLTCENCGVDLTHGVRYKGTYKCKECSPVFEMNKQDYLNVVELNVVELNERLINVIDLKNATNNNLRNEIKELEKQLKEMISIVNGRGEEIEKLRLEIDEMKTLKVCMKCQIKEKETIDKWISEGRYLFIDNCLQEDCEMCKGEYKNKFVEVIEQTNYGFEDSWMLSYKVEGMKEPIIQHHLTKEECEIIYGNMNNITYWFMEVMEK